MTATVRISLCADNSHVQTVTAKTMRVAMREALSVGCRIGKDVYLRDALGGLRAEIRNGVTKIT
jgi:CRISPR/Cas system-associated exonuclease Cas4 (RecB family)